MPDWKQYVQQNLHLRGVRADREAEIIEDLSRQLEDAYREALASGMPETGAQAFAKQHIPDWDTLRRELQGLSQGVVPVVERLEESADSASRGRRGWAPLGGFVRDMLFGLRMMRKDPGFTLMVVLTLALGIGATSAVFGVVNAVLLRPLPYPDADRLVMMWELASVPGKAPETVSVSWQDFLDWRSQARSFEHLGVFRVQSANLTRVDPPQRLRVSMTSSAVFHALGVAPLLGRTFVPQEDEPGAPPTVILSETLWRSRFSAAPDILGRAITLDGITYEVAGVMPEQMRFPAQVDGWLPLGPFVKNMPGDRGSHPNLTVVARLRPGVAEQTAQAEMNTVAAHLASQYPNSNRFTGVLSQSLYRVVVGSIRTNLLTLVAAVGFILLIACVNIANLMLARGETRLREVAVRRALGASRFRLVSQMLTESTLLALCGASIGGGLAWLALEVLVKSKPTFIPRIYEIRMDVTVLGFTCLLALVVAVLFGLWPALRITSRNAQISLRDLTRTASARSYLRPFLVAGQACFATILMIGAALLIRTFAQLTRIDLGFRPEHVLTLRVTLPTQRYPSADHASAFYREVLGRVSALPQTQVAGISTMVPLGGGGSESGIFPEGTPLDREHPGPGCTFSTVSGGYFQAMGINLLRGRTFDDHDAAGKSPVIVVDESAVAAFWPGQDPLGKRVAFEARDESSANPKPVWRVVVGVVRRVRSYDLTGNTTRIQVYVPFTQPPIYYRTLPSMALMVRTEADPATLAGQIRRAVSTLDSELPLFQLRTMSEYVDSTLEQPRLSMMVLAAFGGLGLLLAAVGIYGVLSYSVSRRTREIGIRMALGATRGDVLQRILREGALISAAGVVAGIAGSLVCMRLIRDLLFGVTATDLGTYITIPLLLFAVALCATLVPAYRATRVEPIVALRED